MNIVDSCGWLEYFTDGPNADFFSPAIEDIPNLIISSICLYEVFKRILQQRNEGDALQAIAVMAQGKIIELDAPLALNAAKLSTEHSLPMADSIILATSRSFDAVLWTQDSDFKNIEGVRYIEKVLL